MPFTTDSESPQLLTRARSGSTSSSTSSYKRARAVIAPELPDSVAWLENASLEMTATASKSLTHGSAEYILHVHYRTTPDSEPVSWEVSRSFDQYRAFQKRLLKTLAYGHFCNAECRWLHRFAKKYFPKKSLLFGEVSTSTINKRREKLNRFMNVLQASLVNRGNHNCAIIVKSLASEFSTFIKGGVRHRLTSLSSVNSDDEDGDFADDEKENDRVRRYSMSSSMSTESTDGGNDSSDSLLSSDLRVPLCDGLAQLRLL